MPRLLPSLKARIALITTVLAAVLGTGIVLGSLYYAQGDLEDVLQNQQESIVKLSVDQLDTAMQDRIVMLTHLAPQLSGALAAAPSLSRDTLRSRMKDVVTRSVPTPEAFDSILVADARGSLLTMNGGAPADISDRAYFREAVRTHNFVVAAPLRARTDGSMGVLLAVPILSPSGEFMGLVAGWLNLAHSNFLVEIGHSRLGITGFYCLVSAGAAPVYIQHPDPAQANRPAPITGNTCGVDDRTAPLEFLTPTRPVIARRIMATTGWELVAVLPAREAYAPLRQMQRRFLMMSGIVLAVVALLIWLALRRLLMPLSRLHQVVRDSASDVDAFERLPQPQRDEIGDVTRAFTRLMRDVRQRGQQLARSERRLRAVTDTLPVLLAFIDNDERYVFNNAAYERAFGLPVDRIRGMTVRELIGEERYLRAQPHLQRARAGSVISFEGEFAHPHPHWMETTYRPEWSEDGKQVVGVHIHVEDITQRKLETQRLAHLSQTDHLTQLQNRGAFEAHLRDAMALVRSENRLMALLYLDMDRFKAVNDTHGHATGDLLLQSFALRLRRCVRKQDHVARLGGDEFAVILADIDTPTAARRVAEAILESVGRQFYFDGVTTDVDVSIGVALYQGAPLSEEALMRMADVLLYRAKALGRGRYEIGPAELLTLASDDFRR
ncbi:diguanylate cyclase domain-containing protein [Cupriavidus pauculus]|uniref:sensor domain-containing diguanylate cyclase n=1 Tax=Cupriavidus pauculus TaxID=82633 RepID=UPI001EE37834|nr:diguanylate cyclase [Cupriavidus pauculus]GJG94697.1 diguanylate cyclase [Cupriavidus pauculus]